MTLSLFRGIPGPPGYNRFNIRSMGRLPFWAGSWGTRGTSGVSLDPIRSVHALNLRCVR